MGIVAYSSLWVGQDANHQPQGSWFDRGVAVRILLLRAYALLAHISPKVDVPRTFRPIGFLGFRLLRELARDLS